MTTAAKISDWVSQSGNSPTGTSSVNANCFDNRAAGTEIKALDAIEHIGGAGFGLTTFATGGAVVDGGVLPGQPMRWRTWPGWRRVRESCPGAYLGPIAAPAARSEACRRHDGSGARYSRMIRSTFSTRVSDRGVRVADVDANDQRGSPSQQGALPDVMTVSEIERLLGRPLDYWDGLG
ncbi:MAG TPA: hypothetical protein VFC19_48265 [Candidatus Limnocylindrales bacterium]|nr:hypothetical protein [Candidatus Limnocylindrales bacterium]